MVNTVADALSQLQPQGSTIQVTLSNELVHLLSDQLYQSPLKAIEELVVNSYDADAATCRIFVSASDQPTDYIVVFDDGIGMNVDGLTDLWQIGRSKKRLPAIEKLRKRKQIGKFGIGKLAARTIANQLTYISKTSEGILCVTIDFRDFGDSGNNPVKQIETQVRVVNDLTGFVNMSGLSRTLASACINLDDLNNGGSWTVALLESLTDKAHKIKLEPLRWVLSTAMPLKADFRLFLNCEEITSSKDNLDQVVTFDLSRIPQERLDSLKSATGEAWRSSNGQLVSDSFPSGIRGHVIVTRKTLGGKSDDIQRSHGFFIRVRNRLVNENDALFGLSPLVFGTFSRFRADIDADDLDGGLKASRETVGDSSAKIAFRSLLREVFNEASTRYEKVLADEHQKGNPKREGERSDVPARLVEFPVADVLVSQAGSMSGTEPDERWFYIDIGKGSDVSGLIQSLYASKREKYRYQYTKLGKTARVVKFDPLKATFWINEDHEFVTEYYRDDSSQRMLHDVVTAEVLLEVYLRQANIHSGSIAKILEQRDELLRRLAEDSSYSLESIVRRLRDSGADKYELEISLVVAARALGFVATHIAGAAEPDGLAQLTDYPNGETKITLEAKSSISTPSLPAIDFAGLSEHMLKYDASGCLLLAPSYPGDAAGDENAVSRRAKDAKVSCWTIDQLARVVNESEKRQLHARNVLAIVLNKYAPVDVEAAIQALLDSDSRDQEGLYVAVLRSLRQLEGRLKDMPRTVDLIAAEVSREDPFRSVEGKEVRKALEDLAGASQGGLLLRSDNIVLQVSIAELERRVAGLTKKNGEPRRKSGFRANEQF